MKKTVLFILLFACTLNTSCSATHSDAERIVRKLSSTVYAGRMVGTEGNEKSVDFIATEFQRAGLQPLLSDGYRQYFPLDRVDLSGTNSYFAIEYADGTILELQFGKDYFFRAGCQDMDLELPLNFGSDPQPNADSIHVISDLKNYNLEKAPVLIYLNDEILFTPGVPTEESPMRIFIPASVATRIKLEQSVRAQVKAKGGTMEYEAANVVGCIPGKDRSRAIVLTAHLDGCGQQGSFLFPGALDNTSGISAIIGCAESLHTSYGKDIPDVDIVFAAVNSEEYSDGKSLKGSATLVEYLESYYSDLYNINIDCVGMDRAFSMGLIDTRSAGLNQAIRTALVQYGLQCDESQYAPSDHRSFLSAGYAAVVIGQTALGQSLQTHRVTDVADALDFTIIDKVIRAVCQMVRTDGIRVFETTKEGSSSDDPRLDDDEWWAEVKKESERVLDGRTLAYDEQLDFLYKDVWCTVSGWKPFTTVEDAQIYFPNYYFASHDGSPLVELEIMLAGHFSDLTVHTGEVQKSAQFGVVRKIEIDRMKISQINATFKDLEQYRRIAIRRSPTDPFLREGTTQTLTGEYSEIIAFRYSWDTQDQYLSVRASCGSWWMEISEYTIAKDPSSELEYPPIDRSLKETEDWVRSMGLHSGLEEIIVLCGIDK